MYDHKFPFSMDCPYPSLWSLRNIVQVLPLLQHEEWWTFVPFLTVFVFLRATLSLLWLILFIHRPDRTETLSRNPRRPEPGPHFNPLPHSRLLGSQEKGETRTLTRLGQAHTSISDPCLSTSRSPFDFSDLVEELGSSTVIEGERILWTSRRTEDNSQPQSRFKSLT